MNSIHFAENAKIVPVIAPVDTVATAVASSYVGLRDANWLTFLVQFGALTSDSTDIATITVEASNVGTSTDSEAAIAFSYRLSAAVATDSMGAIASATSSGYAGVTATSDNKMVVIDIDPAAVATLSGIAATYVRVVVTPNSEMASCLVNAIALVDGKYKGNSIPTSS